MSGTTETPVVHTKQIKQTGKVNQQFYLSKDEQKRADDSVGILLCRLNLTASAVPIPLHGNKPLEFNSISTYHKHD
ncbi:hypothetical protein HK100_006054 [Physocladia obscura]|uniref:Uncharacterized protein n=1 Tax=Physocladia obscura TaxID=109957 RepID=A0AAD5T6G8_9FUNG|nr:hypothetical protein HK100_006054 [Physocladia obscura]